MWQSGLAKWMKIKKEEQRSGGEKRTARGETDNCSVQWRENERVRENRFRWRERREENG